MVMPSSRGGAFFSTKTAANAEPTHRHDQGTKAAITKDHRSMAGRISARGLTKINLLGSGSFGQVWLVASSFSRRAPTKKYHALKVQSKYELTKAGRARFVARERNAMAELKHPFLCPLVQSFQDDQFVYMVMGLVRGVELFDVIHMKRGPFAETVMPESHAVFYAAAIVDSLRYMHSKGYVYRDLKPSNVMIAKDGYPVLIDFGFCKKIADYDTHTMCGTPLYVAPEIILKAGHGKAVDYWALGVMIYEMLTSRHPFWRDGISEMDLFRATVRGKYSLPSSYVSSEAQSIICSLLRQNPFKRLGGETVVEHDWFSAVDFQRLVNKKIRAPYRPRIEDIMTVETSRLRHPETMEDKMIQSYPELLPHEAQVFQAF